LRPTQRIFGGVRYERAILDGCLVTDRARGRILRDSLEYIGLTPAGDGIFDRERSLRDADGVRSGRYVDDAARRANTNVIEVPVA
jgi:hypothetical protein